MVTRGRLEYITRLVADFMRVDLDELDFIVSVVDDGTAAYFDSVHKKKPTIVLYVGLIFFGNDSVVAWVIAHELAHYKQWRDGYLACASDLASRKPIAVWHGSQSSPEIRFTSTAPWEVDADSQADEVISALANNFQEGAA